MSVQPGQHNIVIQRRADYELRLQFRDSTGTGINLSGWTAYAQAWDKGRSVKYADFSVSYINRSVGQIAIALTHTETAGFPNEAFYDVLLEDSLGLKNYYLEGIMYVSEGYTAP
jgi:hypothetical protein